MKKQRDLRVVIEKMLAVLPNNGDWDSLRNFMWGIHRSASFAAPEVAGYLWLGLHEVLPAYVPYPNQDSDRWVRIFYDIWSARDRQAMALPDAPADVWQLPGQ